MAIRTPRLRLRALTLADASRLALLAGDYDVASMTGTIPYPYSEEMAADWIASVLAGEEGVVFAIIRSGVLIGCTGYRAFGPDHAELGYWIGKPYWGMGYATEAARALMDWAAEEKGIRRFIASVAPTNDPSLAIVKKLGFIQTGE